MKLYETILELQFFRGLLINRLSNFHIFRTILSGKTIQCQKVCRFLKLKKWKMILANHSENITFFPSNCSSHNCDVYYGLFENRPSKFILIAISCVLSFFNILIFYGIIWFERYGMDSYSTLMNRILSSNCWTVLAGFNILIFLK